MIGTTSLALQGMAVLTVSGTGSAGEPVPAATPSGPRNTCAARSSSPGRASRPATGGRSGRWSSAGTEWLARVEPRGERVRPDRPRRDLRHPRRRAIAGSRSTCPGANSSPPGSRARCAWPPPYWARITRVCYGFSIAQAATVGFDDQYFYDELAKPLPARKVREAQVLGDEGFALLKGFAADPKRVKY